MPARTTSPWLTATCESPRPPPDTGPPTARTTGSPSRSSTTTGTIELSLKWLIRKAAQCALREGGS
ncbi:hypothetical protein [Streptomyces sp. NPDC006147]|uniref:hypothetical protein n=1 Tax=Streptomyces sp. NPDC006147 TaxID=3155597 RepID=UPI0033AB46A4